MGSRHVLLERLNEVFIIMENFTNILKQFTMGQRIFVLVLLLFFTSITSILTTYFASDYNSCNNIVKENRELLQDYILISQMIREQQMPRTESSDLRMTQILLDSASVDESRVISRSAPKDPILDSILNISDSHIKK
jgi:hypothetical protein